MKDLILRIKSFLKPVWNKPTDYVIIPSFKLGGIQYYEYADYVNMPFERALAMRHCYQELDMKVDRDVLEAHTLEFDKSLEKLEELITVKDGSLNLKPIFKEISNLRLYNMDINQKLKHISEPGMIYKLASVCYFDANENPQVYDHGYNEKKIAEWKKHKMSDFFLTVPLSRLIPFIDFSKIDIETFTKVNQAAGALMVKTIENYLESPNSHGMSSDLRSSLQQRKEALKNILQSEGLDYENIISSLQSE